ncbi:MAG TPA: hypothetical protein VKR43_10505 [Bryobacteraceae bacterium]|nr:hypothetical protein [Bryobacteraceae bacterium]
MIAVLLLASGKSLSAIEKFTLVRTADAVVVGQLKLSSYFVSFDGVHVNGSIAATENLFGGGNGSEFAYHQIVPCRLLAGCDYRAVWANWSKMKELFSQKQIWALVKAPGSAWTSVNPQLLPIYGLADREEVIEALRQRRQLNR